MARTALPYSNLVANSNLSQPAGTTIDQANGMVIAAARPELTILRVANTNGTDRVVTIKAGDNPPALAAGQGDLAVTVAATTGVQFIGPFESGRFIQADGTMEIDFAASFAGTITALKVPRGT
ncbi:MULTISPECIES: hypothetical protein [unclassified Nonomuraea]|uniref:hypothetical protein n=1 Tax=unclassified Nonomuraea TaxID=2593643 RepID=UPI0033E86658